MGNNALFFALGVLEKPNERLQEGHLSVTKLLIEKGIDINHQNKDGSTAIFLAAKHGLTACAEYLIENNANIYLRNVNGLVPYAFALENKHMEIAAALQQKMRRDEQAELKFPFQESMFASKPLLQHSSTLFKQHLSNSNIIRINQCKNVFNTFLTYLTIGDFTEKKEEGEKSNDDVLLHRKRTRQGNSLNNDNKRVKLAAPDGPMDIIDKSTGLSLSHLLEVFNLAKEHMGGENFADCEICAQPMNQGTNQK